MLYVSFYKPLNTRIYSSDVFVPSQYGFLLFGNSVIYFQVKLSFCPRHFVFLNTVQVGFVWCTSNTSQGNEETLKGQNALPLSYLLHVNLYTMSNHAIIMRVCVRVYVCV